MKDQLNAIRAELLKLKNSKITWITFLVFSIAPLMGGLFMLILGDSGQNFSGMLKAKAEMMSFEVNWVSYLGLLSQSVAIAGILLFGFVSSWIFGREFSDGTAKDILALPISRIKIVNAKFLVYTIWSFALTLSNLAIGLIIAMLLDLPGLSDDVLTNFLYTYLISGMLCIVADLPVAVFASIGRGYMAPLGFVVLTLVFSQIIAAIGFGSYFPWAIPGIFSGAAGPDMQLSALSYIVLIGVSLLGYAATLVYWKYADHAK